MHLPKVILLPFVDPIIGLATARPQRWPIWSKIQGSTVLSLFKYFLFCCESLLKIHLYCDYKSLEWSKEEIVAFSQVTVLPVSIQQVVVLKTAYNDNIMKFVKWLKNKDCSKQQILDIKPLEHWSLEFFVWKKGDFENQSNLLYAISLEISACRRKYLPLIIHCQMSMSKSIVQVFSLAGA